MRKREDIDNKYKWDLSKIYKNKDLWYEDINQLNNKVTKINEYKNNILKTSENLLDVITLYYDISRHCMKIYMYAKLNYDLCLTDKTANELKNKADEVINNIYTALSFIMPEISVSLTKEKLSTYYEETPKLKKYDYFFRNIFKEKKHILSDKEERILSSLSIIASSSGRIFDNINDTVESFGKFKDENGKIVNLTHGNYSIYIRSNNRNIRKKVFKLYHNYYKTNFPSIGECLRSSIISDNTISSLRNYSSSLSSALSADDVKEEFYNSLINITRDNINLFHEYLKYKKDILKLNKMHMYDMYVPIVNYDKNITFDECTKLVFDSLKVMNKEYHSIASSSVKNNWVDVYETKAKATGAYSFGSYDTVPYILLNYENNYSSVETFAHELGHSMHSYYSRSNNEYFESEYPIILAEIASNTHELLLFNHIINTTKDIKEKKYMLYLILESFKGSVFRQVMFAESEKLLHEMDNLTVHDMLNTYYELNKFYYGKDVVSDEEIKYELLRIPHFYNSFYVYKYATGLMVSYIFCNQILNGNSENYIKFLISSGKKEPLEVLKDAGIDLENENIIKESFKIFKEYLEEFKRIKE